MKIPFVPGALFFLALFSLPVHAEESKAACVFVALNDNAWVSSKDSQIKSTLKVGDVLKEGDRVIVTHGNKVQLAFDKDCKNIVQIEGDAVFFLNPSAPGRIELQSGTMFALMDGLNEGAQFGILTPSAVAEVRGTQYQVTTLDQKSNIMTYRGEVLVSGRDSGGETTLESVVVSAGKKTAVASPGKTPEPATDMSETERSEIDRVLENVEKTRQSLSAQEVGSWLDKTPSAAAGGTSGERTVSGVSKNAPKKGLVVI